MIIETILGLAFVGVILYFVLGRTTTLLEDKEPSGWHLGPIIDGNNYSKGGLVDWAEENIILVEEPHYFTRSTGKGELERKTFMEVTVEVDGKVKPKEYPTATPLLSLYLQRKGDDWSGKNEFSAYRWWSKETVPLVPGEKRTFRVPLSFESWVPVWKRYPAFIHEESFVEAVLNSSRIGVTFGSAAGRGHGVVPADLRADAPTITIKDFKVV